MITLTLPYPPTVNRYLGVTRTGRRFKAKPGSDYVIAVRSICAQQRVRPIEGDVAFEMRLYRPRKCGDVQNYNKVLLDALEGWAYENDKQISEFHAYRYDDKDNPRVEVQIWKTGEQKGN